MLAFFQLIDCNCEFYVFILVLFFVINYEVHFLLVVEGCIVNNKKVRIF